MQEGLSQVCRRLSLVLALGVLGASRALQAQEPTTCGEPRDACAFFDTFVSAFNRRDWPAFQATLDPDVSTIFDRPGPPRRQDGHVAVESIFRLIFPDAPLAAGTVPFQIHPQQLRAQAFGDVVVISFHLPDAGAVGRRTLVLHRTPAGWKVVHIHGSSS
jgi:SnoaL-like domain